MRNIVRHPHAEEEWELILCYWIERNGSLTYAQELDQRLERLLQLLSAQPFIGKEVPGLPQRMAILHPYCVFYDFTDTQLQLLAVWDRRRDPAFAPYPIELNEP